MKHFLVLFFAIVVASRVLAADFELRILSYPKEAVLSTPVPITAEITNVSGRAITVAYGHGGFTVSLDIRRSDGKPLPPYSGPVAKWTDNFQRETIPVGWQQVRTLDAIPVPVENCELIVQAVLASHGPYFHYDKGEKSSFEAWNGEVKSEEARIQIIEPSGVDKEAYDDFKGLPLSHPQDLLAKFPASTYAGYAVCEPMRHIYEGDQDKFMRALELGSTLSAGSVLDDTGTSKNGFRSMGGKELAEWKAKWIGIVLKNHPDIWFADDIRLVRALDQIALKNYQAGAADLETLSKEAKPEVAARAKVYLELIKQKGWIKE